MADWCGPYSTCLSSSARPFLLTDRPTSLLSLTVYLLIPSAVGPPSPVQTTLLPVVLPQPAHQPAVSDRLLHDLCRIWRDIAFDYESSMYAHIVAM